VAIAALAGLESFDPICSQDKDGAPNPGVEFHIDRRGVSLQRVGGDRFQLGAHANSMRGVDSQIITCQKDLCFPASNVPGFKLRQCRFWALATDQPANQPWGAAKR